MMMNRTAFYNKYEKYAKKASDLTGLNWKQILANWSWETNFASNNTYKYNNMGGIKFVGQSMASGKSGSPGYAKYNSLDDFVVDYARVMNLSYYDQIHKATETETLKDDVIAHNKSPYSVADYDVNQIMNRISEIGKIGGGAVDESEIIIPKLDLENLDKKDLLKYAGIGLAVVSVINFFNR